MRGGQGARRRRGWTRPALERVSGRTGGSRTVVGCITRRGPRDASIRSAFTAAIYEFATHIADLRRRLPARQQSRQPGRELLRVEEALDRHALVAPV